MKRPLFFLLLLLLLLAPNMPATNTALVTDTFTRANSATLGPNWALLASSVGGNSACRITSNKAQGTTASTNCFANWGANDFPNDQFSQVTDSTLLGTATVRSCVRMVAATTSGAGPNISGYCTNGALASPYTINTVTAGLFAAIATSAQNMVAGDVILLLVQTTSTGPQVTLFVNTIQILQVTDTSYTFLAGQPGMAIAEDGTTTDGTVSNWVGGAVTTSPTIVNGTAALQLGATLQLSGGTNPTSLTGTGQAVQFTLPPSSFQYLGRLQIIVTGQVSNPFFALECSQDGLGTWFQMPAIGLPTFSPQLGDLMPSISVFYDVTGLSSGATCRFGLAPYSPAAGVTTVITGNLQVWGMIG